MVFSEKTNYGDGVMGKKKSGKKGKNKKQSGATIKIQDLYEGITWVSSDPPDFEPPEMPSHFIMEQTMHSLFDGGRKASKSDKRFQAQDLAYQAMDAYDDDTAADLASQALEIDPNCVDAFMILAELSCETQKELIEQMRIAVDIGKRGLGGESFFKKNRGYFWGLLETRPYMRARAYLAELLVEVDRNDEAIEHYEALLKLNPNDNQGLRYPLLGCYFITDNLDGVHRLFKEYEDEGSAMFAWALVLERYLSGDEKAATKALKEARKTNKHVEKYLTGKKQIPRNLPEYYGFGDESEAIVCVDELGAAWRRKRKA
jgi:tetratricopeptide (TPR) repeat protein